uniref:RING-type domain-containing protein n=1 Tax=Salix viminalis TaxID=40686 RepID=A0A6N2KWT0_SALVM
MGGESSMGALVPSLYSEATTSKMPPPTEELDKDILCPICMQIIKDAFLTSCGHSFCYMCITTHLRNKNDCPCCSHYLTSNLIFPNFLLNKILERNYARQAAKNASPYEHLRQALQQVSCCSFDG